MPGECTHIAIIGGGASGTITAIQLLRKLHVTAKVYLIEKKPQVVYRGAAYSSQLDYEPLNVPAGKMSLYNHLPDHFFQWLTVNGKGNGTITRDSFVSRRWFGDYLTDNINHVKATSKHATLEVITGEVRDITPAHNNSYNLLLADGAILPAHYVIFATGNETPADILSRNEVAELGSKYVSNPWVGNTLNNVKHTDDVLVIGTGLTMVDHVVSLGRRGHTGKVYCLSRNGYLPMPHTTMLDTLLTIPDDIEDIRQLAGVLRAKVNEAGAKNIAWQNVLDALRPRTSRLWRNLDVASKRYFLKRLKPYWEIHRHRMPLASANALSNMMATGQLKLISGNVVSAALHNGRILFRYYDRKTATTNNLTVDLVLNCTGPSGDYYKCDNLLMINLLNKGWLQQDELKLGIKTGTRGEIIKDNGVVLHNAYAIGPVRKATEWESTAVREIRTHAEQVAFLIAEQTERRQELMVEIGL